MTAPVAGQPAPDFTLPTDGGEEISLSKLKGKVVVLYFYPKDDTPGCTTEAIDFSSRIGDFEAANAACRRIASGNARISRPNTVLK